jgi:PKHD-type hydroxylase
MRAAIDAADWVDGRATVGSQGAQVKRNRQLPEHSPVAQEQGRIILQALAASPLFFSAALPARTMPPLFNRYSDSEPTACMWTARHAASGSEQWLRTDVSCTLFLCEPEDYEGGELVVVDTYGTRGQAACGRPHLYCLPACTGSSPSHAASGSAPSSGPRAWCVTIAPRHAVRDGSGHHRPARKVGETEETVSLTGHYHNLLRMGPRPENVF